ncbi:MAG TPA: hypothetical protein DCR40_01120 [Prolixibacteraceae bacterium]|nr:hypothetical protein [Prolixibacteraceae bacterium]
MVKAYIFLKFIADAAEWLLNLILAISKATQKGIDPAPATSCRLLVFTICFLNQYQHKYAQNQDFDFFHDQ